MMNRICGMTSSKTAIARRWRRQCVEHKQYDQPRIGVGVCRYRYHQHHPPIGTVLSPVITATTGFTTTVGFSHAGIATAEGIAIDPSGNVWVASQVAATGGVFELVGAAAPTVTPISLALKNTKIGGRP